MPLYRVHTVVVREFEADSPEEAHKMVWDGDCPRHCDVDAWVDSIWDENEAKLLWPSSKS